MSRSTENIPLPEIKIIIDKIKNTKAKVLSWKVWFANAIKKTTTIVIRIGIIVSRVKNPIATKKPQKNSANMTRMNEVLEPIPMRSGNLGRNSLYDINFVNP